MDFAVTLGLFQGDAGRLNPQTLVTRQEMVTVIYRMVHGTQVDERPEGGMGHIPFTDVAMGHWSRDMIRWAWLNSIVDTHDTFRPFDPVTFQEAVAMILRSMNISVAGAGFDQNVQLQVNRLNLNARLNVAPRALLSREQVAQLIDNTFFTTGALPQGAVSLATVMGLNVVSGTLVSNEYASILDNGNVQPKGWSMIARPRLSGVNTGAGGSVGTWQGPMQNVLLEGTSTATARIEETSSLWWLGMDVTAIVRMANNIWQVGIASNVQEVVDLRLTRDMNRVEVVSNARAANWTSARRVFHNYVPVVDGSLGLDYLSVLRNNSNDAIIALRDETLFAFDTVIAALNAARTALNNAAGALAGGVNSPNPVQSTAAATAATVINDLVIGAPPVAVGSRDSLNNARTAFISRINSLLLNPTVGALEELMNDAFNAGPPIFQNGVSPALTAARAALNTAVTELGTSNTTGFAGDINTGGNNDAARNAARDAGLAARDALAIVDDSIARIGVFATTTDLGDDSTFLVLGAVNAIDAFVSGFFNNDIYFIQNNITLFDRIRNIPLPSAVGGLAMNVANIIHWYTDHDSPPVQHTTFRAIVEALAADLEDYLDENEMFEETAVLITLKQNVEIALGNILTVATGALAVLDAAPTTANYTNVFLPAWATLIETINLLENALGGASLNNTLRAQRVGDFTIFVSSANNASTWEYAFQVERTYGVANVLPSNGSLMSAGIPVYTLMSRIGGTIDLGNAVLTGDPVVTFPLPSGGNYAYYAMLPEVEAGRVTGSDATGTRANVAWAAGSSMIPLSNVMNVNGTGNIFNNTERMTRFNNGLFQLITGGLTHNLAVEYLPLANFTGGGARYLLGSLGTQRTVGDYFILSYIWDAHTHDHHSFPTGYITLTGETTGKIYDINRIDFDDGSGREPLIRGSATDANNLNWAAWQNVLGIQTQYTQALTRADRPAAANVSVPGNYVFGTFSTNADGSLNLAVLARPSISAAGGAAGTRGDGRAVQLNADGVSVGTNNRYVNASMEPIQAYTANSIFVRRSTGLNQIANIGLTNESSFFMREGPLYDGWRWREATYTAASTGTGLGLVLEGRALAAVYVRDVATLAWGAWRMGMVTNVSVDWDASARAWYGTVTVQRSDNTVETVRLPNSVSMNQALTAFQSANATMLSANTLNSGLITGLGIVPGDFVRYRVHNNPTVVMNVEMNRQDLRQNETPAGMANFFGAGTFRAGFVMNYQVITVGTTQERQIAYAPWGLATWRFVTVPAAANIYWVDLNHNVTRTPATDDMLRAIMAVNNMQPGVPQLFTAPDQRVYQVVLSMSSATAVDAIYAFEVRQNNTQDGFTIGLSAAGLAPNEYRISNTNMFPIYVQYKLSTDPWSAASLLGPVMPGSDEVITLPSNAVYNFRWGVTPVFDAGWRVASNFTAHTVSFDASAATLIGGVTINNTGDNSVQVRLTNLTGGASIAAASIASGGNLTPTLLAGTQYRVEYALVGSSTWTVVLCDDGEETFWTDYLIAVANGTSPSEASIDNTTVTNTNAGNRAVIVEFATDAGFTMIVRSHPVAADSTIANADVPAGTYFVRYRVDSVGSPWITTHTNVTIT
jgi:hypothetical protein